MTNARMTVVVLYYNGDYFEAQQVEIDDDGVAIRSTDPTSFGLPATVDITAVIVTPDVDCTQVLVEGDVIYGELE